MRSTSRFKGNFAQIIMMHPHGNQTYRRQERTSTGALQPFYRYSQNLKSLVKAKDALVHSCCELHIERRSAVAVRLS